MQYIKLSNLVSITEFYCHDIETMSFFFKTIKFNTNIYLNLIEKSNILYLRYSTKMLHVNKMYHTKEEYDLGTF